MTPGEGERSADSDRPITPPDQVQPAEPAQPDAVSLEKPVETGEAVEKGKSGARSASARPTRPAAGGSHGSGGWRPVALIGAAAVVLAVIAAVAAFRPGADVSNVAWVETSATQEVTEAAKVAIESMHGYDYRTIDEDFAQIRELLTPERLEEFDSTAEVTKKAAVDTRTVTEVTVEHIGATMLDDNRAEVAAYINVSATGDGIAQGSAAAPLLVRMEKSDGRWLVSEIRDQ